MRVSSIDGDVKINDMDSLRPEASLIQLIEFIQSMQYGYQYLL